MRATTLRLVTAEDPPQTLGEWDVTQAKGNGTLSLEISALLEEHCATIQRHTEAVLGWVIGDSRVVASKRLRARYTPPADEGEDGDALSFEALGINGTTIGQVIQMQRHIEVRERTSNTFVHGLMQTALQLNGQLSAQLQDAYTRIHELQQQQIESAAATAAEYQEIAGETVEPLHVDPAAEARTQALQVVTQIAQTFGPQLIQAALVRLTSPQSAIQLAPLTPPTPTPPPSSPTPPAAPTAPAAAAATVAVPTTSATAPASPPARRVQRATSPAPRAAARGRK